MPMIHDIPINKNKIDDCKLNLDYLGPDPTPGKTNFQIHAFQITKLICDHCNETIHLQADLAHPQGTPYYLMEVSGGVIATHNLIDYYLVGTKDLDPNKIDSPRIMILHTKIKLTERFLQVMEMITKDYNQRMTGN